MFFQKIHLLVKLSQKTLHRLLSVHGHTPKFISKLPAVPVIGNGRYTRQPVHVDDFNGAINHLIANERFDGGVFDIGGPEAHSMDRIIDILCRIAGKRVVKVHLPKQLFLLAANVVKTFHKDLLSTTDCDERVDNGPLLA